MFVPESRKLESNLGLGFHPAHKYCEYENSRNSAVAQFHA